MEYYEQISNLLFKKLEEPLNLYTIEKVLAESESFEIELEDVEKVFSLEENKCLLNIIRDLFDFVKELILQKKENQENLKDEISNEKVTEVQKPLLMYLGEIEHNINEKEFLASLLSKSKFYYLFIILFINTIKHYTPNTMIELTIRINKSNITCHVINDYNDYNKRLINDLLRVKKDGSKNRLELILNELGGELTEIEASCQVFATSFKLNLL